MPSFYIPLSGLNADSTALNTIANNLSNMNTTGFKEQTTNFSDLFYQQVGTTGAGGEIQQGTGVQVASNSTDFTGGSISSTGVSTDVAIDGTGFFVLDAGGGEQLYTRDGNFQLSSTGTLESTEGQGVMGYAATNGVINTSGGLTDITIPTGQVMQPSATTSFSISQNLNSASPIGAQTSGQVQVYDSLGKSYEATVTYTNLGNNKWSYAITLPDTLTATAATAAAASTMNVTASTPAATSVTSATTVSEPSVTVANPVTAATPTTVATAPALNSSAAVAVASTNTLLKAQAGSPAGTFIYNFPTSNGALATVDTTTSTLQLTGKNGGGTTVTAPAVTFTYGGGAPPETLADYVTDLNTALTTSGIVGVTINSPAAGELSIVGPGTLTAAGNIGQDFSGTKLNYNFLTSNGALSTVDPTTSLTITGPTTAGGTTTVGPLVVTAGETAATYAAALQAQITAANITGVTVGFNGGTGQMSIIGPTTITTGGSITQAFSGVQTNYTFGSYTDPATGLTTKATVDPSTSLTISALNTSGVKTPVTILPSNPAGETVAQYATDITTALATAKISGVTATSANGVLSLVGPSNMTIAGYVNQDILGTTVTSAVSPTTPVTTASTASLAPAPAVTDAPSTTTITPVSDSTTVPGTTADTYTFAATGTVSGSTSVTITGPTKGGGPPATTSIVVTPSVPDESVAAFFTNDVMPALTASNIKTGAGGVNITNPAANELVISGPTASLVVNGAVKQDVALTTTNYNFVTSNATLASVGPTTTLAITEGGKTVTALPFTSAVPISSYVTSLQNALTSNGITDVTVADNNGVLAITNPTSATISGNVVQSFTGAQTSFDFGTYTDPNTGLTTAATVAPSTTLTISAPTITGGTANVTITPSDPAGESLNAYLAQVQTALAANGITGVTVTAANGVLSIVAPDTVTIAGSVNQNMLGTTNNYAFQTNSTVDPTTNLKISGQTATGATAIITAPPVSAGETVSQYAKDLTAALTTAGITNVDVSSTNGQLSIVGANFSTTGSVNQGLADVAINYNFGSSATVDSTTALTIVGPTVTGVPATAITVAPAVTAGETVAEYAVALNKALATAGINTSTDGVSVTANGGQLTIVGPAATLKTAGIANQDLTTTTISYAFGTSGGSIAAVDPKTDLAITALTASGATATTVAPQVTLGESLAQYVNDLTSALSTAGIAGVTVSSTAGGVFSITGANLSTSGSVIQDPVASANSSGTLTFNSSGNLVGPAADLSNITFAGFTDSAATMNMTWDLFGASGSGNISQTAAAKSGQSGQNQNGYTSGENNGFTIGSDGTVSATYSNGQSQNVGQLAIATVSNQQGLVDMGSTQYQATANSGLATVGVASSGGRGSLEGSSLEASNVNISAEFSNLIIAQRAFEANSKAVTTFDTVTQETINMIH
jgi:flagellar hook-basal body protein